VRPLSLDRTSPQEGESVVVIGNPLGLEAASPTVSFQQYAIFRLCRSFKSPRRFLRSSGSPVVNMRGEVIGVATLQITGGQSELRDPSERIAQLDRTAQTDAQQMSPGELVAPRAATSARKLSNTFAPG
jgi:hypothetical protein